MVYSAERTGNSVKPVVLATVSTARLEAGELKICFGRLLGVAIVTMGCFGSVAISLVMSGVTEASVVWVNGSVPVVLVLDATGVLTTVVLVFVEELEMVDAASCTEAPGINGIGGIVLIVVDFASGILVNILEASDALISNMPGSVV